MEYQKKTAMVMSAADQLRLAEIPAKPEPLWKWFQMFIQQHPDLFRVIKTKIK
jgi:hypothetical protein